MGFFFSKSWKELFGKKDVRILMLGLDAAGKTTILYKIKTNETIRTIPTIGFNVESMEYKGLNMVTWDIGGQTNLLKLWKHYYQGTDALIYVVDSQDTERIEMNFEVLNNMLQEPELEKACVLIYANKQDLSGAMTPSEIAEKLGMAKLKNREWMIQGCSGTRGEGLTDGLDWVAKTLLKRK
jgi:small GTP-binding protein